ncbi:MAG: molybdenum cofactor guanylyltransferase [Balneolaceae bacterium]|nr:molybdenum cofactor guanylyltransferase [Balneolaceae bacterium]MCH8547825.1 molybdenum cofactor guanylyltransferase [Balneolaceae bacterium]
MKSSRRLYIFCGGGSRRMGRDKALLELNGETLLSRQVRRTAPLFAEIVLLAGGNSYDLPNRTVQDTIPNAGPLAGLLAALDDQKSADTVAVLPVDIPNLTDSTLQLLSETNLTPDLDALTLQNDETVQPLAGIYTTALAQPLRHYLEDGQRMVMKFLGSIRSGSIEVTEDQLININYPDDYGKIRDRVDSNQT